MKTITVIGDSLSSGGAEHQLSMLMNMLVERGYSVTYADFGEAPDHYSLSEKVNRVKIGLRKKLFLKLLLLEIYLLFVKTDVVIAFSQRLSVLALLPALFRPKIKVISSERNFTIGTPDKFEKILCKTNLYRRASYIVPNSHSQGRYLSQKMPKLADKIHVINNYTDPQIYKFSPIPANNIVKIGVFCRFEEQKNFHRFLFAIAQLVQIGFTNFHVYWYGNHIFSNEIQIDYFETGLRIIRDYKLEQFVSINEPTSDVPNVIPSFDVMSLPSLHEGFSNSISEYICCGRPVICSDVSDNSVMVHEGENGFLFNPMDVKSIVDAFVKYFSLSNEARKQMGERSREIAESLFNKERFINSYINLIEE